MSFGQGFGTENQPPAPLSASTNYYAGIGVTIMFLLGVLLLVMRLRARGRKHVHPIPRRPVEVNLQRRAFSILLLRRTEVKDEEARRQSA